MRQRFVYAFTVVTRMGYPAALKEYRTRKLADEARAAFKAADYIVGNIAKVPR